jgi:putative glutamine amidotransferase
MPPVIGISTRPRELESPEGESSAHTLQRTYTNAVLRAGGVPVLLAPVPDPQVGALIDRIDGLVLSGGGDVDPARYGSATDDTMFGIDFERDQFEIELVRTAKAQRLPTLAICRGLQVVNVALGGSLIEDIPTEVGSADHTILGHEVFNGHQHVSLDPTCLVAKVVGTNDLQVNSIHHQAVREVAPGFRPVGRADDGVIEAIEFEDPEWALLAVQWHPEYLSDADDPASLALFKALVDATAARQLTV